MLFALNENGERITALKGRKATCPLCTSPVLAKCGEIVTWHWAHVSSHDCDPWAEPDNKWHRSWQLKFPPEWAEVVLGGHRADLKTPNGLVIELQHSGISPSEIREREEFYGQMIWLFDSMAFESRLEFYEQGDFVNPWIPASWNLLLAKHDVRREARCRFFWAAPRKTYEACRAPIFFDLGGAVLEVRRLEIGPPAIGYGVVRPVEWFLEHVKTWRRSWIEPCQTLEARS